MLVKVDVPDCRDTVQFPENCHSAAAVLVIGTP